MPAGRRPGTDRRLRRTGNRALGSGLRRLADSRSAAPPGAEVRLAKGHLSCGGGAESVADDADGGLRVVDGHRERPAVAQAQHEAFAAPYDHGRAPPGRQR